MENRVVKVVTGASYGDEGKGLMTAHFCNEARSQGRKCLVILHNGGAQRGHTVVAEDDRRHVFHHLSSGTFSGADSYFTDTFILNPLIFAEEHEELAPDVKVYFSPGCMWSTPFDMMINQIAEDFRGADRHGSCGYGIWETIVRYRGLGMTFPDFMRLDRQSRRAFLEKIRDDYMPRRLAELGVTDIPADWSRVIRADGIIENFIGDCEYFAAHTSPADLTAAEDYQYVVFEGAQGLLLSQNADDKHTTPSFTGAENPVRILNALGWKSGVEVCYVTRTYLTRHGAGPFDGECAKAEINPDMYDKTNIPNGYQGSIRYGKLDIPALRGRITADFAKYADIPDKRLSVAVTHLNETGGMLVTVNGTESPESIGAEHIHKSYKE